MVIEFCPVYSIGFLTSSESVLLLQVQQEKSMSFMFSMLQKFWAHSSLCIWSSDRFSGQLDIIYLEGAFVKLRRVILTYTRRSTNKTVRFSVLRLIFSHEPARVIYSIHASKPGNIRSHENLTESGLWQMGERTDGAENRQQKVDAPYGDVEI